MPLSSDLQRIEPSFIGRKDSSRTEQEEFVNHISDPDYVVEGTEDPDEIRSYIDTIEAIGVDLEVDVTGATDAIEELALRFEPMDYDDHAIGNTPKDAAEGRFSDGDINSMFDRFRT